MRVSIFSLEGNEAQNALAAEALARCSYPWDLLLPGLRAQQGKDTIPIRWKDLSTGEWTVPRSGHLHVHDKEGNVGHVLPDTSNMALDEAQVPVWRRAAWGLAWTHGFIEIEQTLVNRPTAAMQTVLAECGHMLDFFALTEDQRNRLKDALHTTGADDHSHWESGTTDYWATIGEALMNVPIVVYGDGSIPPIAGLVHQIESSEAAAIRNILTPPPPEPPAPPVVRYFATRVNPPGPFHDQHGRLAKRRTFASYQEARDAGYSPCRVCRPAQ